MSIPDKLVLRTGGSNWRDYVPFLVADTTTNVQIWGPDTQYNDVNVAPGNEIAKQFSYFAAYWLNRNKAAVGTVLSVPVHSSGGTFHFRATSTNPVSSYEGLYAPVIGSYVTLTPQPDGIDAGDKAAIGVWNILLRTSGPKPAVGSMGNFQGLLGNPAFKTMTVSTANGRKLFGHATGFYEGFFTANKITRLALVDGTASLTNVTGNTNYIIYDLVETSGSETMFQILNRLDTYAGSNQMAKTDAPTFRSPSVVSFTAGINGYSGTWSERSAATAFSTSTFPDKICVWGINTASDDDTQVFAAYWGNLETGKADSWRLLNPSETLWSLWGNDFHTDSATQRISAGLQTSPGINASVSAYTGDVYLLAFSSGIVVIGNFDMTRTFGSGAFTITQPSSNSSGAFTYSVISGSDVISISGTTITIIKAGTATVQASQAASGSYIAATKNATITINQATPSLTVSKNKYITKYILNGTIYFDVFSTNASGYTRQFSSNNGGVITVPSSSSPNATIAGPGRTTVTVTQSATTNYTAITVYDIIEFVIVGQNQTYTSDDMTSLDLTGTNLTGSVFNSCNLTGADLYNATVNASTSFSTSTLNSLKSGRINGITSLLPPGFTMI